MRSFARAWLPTRNDACPTAQPQRCADRRRCPFREHGAVDMGLPEPYRMISVDFPTFRLSGVYMPNLLATILV